MNVREWIRNKIEKTEAITREDLYKLYDLACEELRIEINYETYTRTIRKLLPLETNINTPNKYEETNTCIKAERIFTRKPQTLEEVTEMFQINSKLWQCVKFSVSSWDVTSTRVGKTATNYSVKAEFKRREDIINYEELKEKFMNDVKEYIPDFIYPSTKQKSIVSGNLLEITIFDLHLAKLGWKPEVGENYDHKIACDIFMRALKDHVEANLHNGFDKILFPVGNDFFNFDTMSGTTTAGTPQNSDLRSVKMFDVGVNLLVDGITYLSQFAPVDVLYVPGNHDQMTSFYAIMFLHAWFNKNNKVDIDISPKVRKYREFENVLIGFTHGDKEKKRIDGLMQIEAREAWGRTKYKEFHMGHMHSSQVREEHGIIFRNLSSVTAADSWHFEKGYVGAVRKSQSFLYNGKTGLINIHNAVVE